MISHEIKSVITDYLQSQLQLVKERISQCDETIFVVHLDFRDETDDILGYIVKPIQSYCYCNVLLDPSLLGSDAYIDLRTTAHQKRTDTFFWIEEILNIIVEMNNENPELRLYIDLLVCGHYLNSLSSRLDL